MKKFTKLLLYIMDLENELAQQVVEEALLGNENAVLVNAAHDAVYKILAQGYAMLKEDIPKVQVPQKKSVKLQLVSSDK